MKRGLVDIERPEMRGARLGQDLYPTHAPKEMDVISPEVDLIDIEAIAVSIYAGRFAVSAAHEVIVSNAKGIKVFPDKIIEGHRSAHGVGFGRLLMNGIAQPSGISVALKPFSSAEDALREFRGYRVLQSLGVETYDPIGVFSARKGECYVGITKKRDDMISLDRERWIRGRQPIDAPTMEVAERNSLVVREVATQLAYLHSNGVFHNDGQIKNYTRTVDGKIGVIDPENLVTLALGELDSIDLAWHDLNKLVKSLILERLEGAEGDKVFGVGMLAGLPLSGVRASIEELIITPYMNELIHSIDEADDERIAHIERLIDGITHLFDSEREWPNHIVIANNRYRA